MIVGVNVIVGVKVLVGASCTVIEPFVIDGDDIPPFGSANVADEIFTDATPDEVPVNLNIKRVPPPDTGGTFA